MASLPAITARLENMDAVLLGPGLGCSGGADAARAGGLAALPRAAGSGRGWHKRRRGTYRCSARMCLSVVLTPHDGEFLRLGGDPKADDRTRRRCALHRGSHAVVLLKGSRTVITDGLNTYVNHTGNPGLATGGSGDVLAGMIVSLLGQHIHAAQAAGRRGMAARRCGRPCGPGAGGIRHGAGGSALRIPRLLP